MPSGSLMAPELSLGTDSPPRDGTLPLSAFDGADTRSWGLYVHIPFCAVRCGYCDFNTYTSDELEAGSRETFPAVAAREMDFAAAVMRASPGDSRKLRSVFFGGGTPTLLGPKPLLALLKKADQLWGLEPGAEVTVEANPDSVTPQGLDVLRAGGVTRVSWGVVSTDVQVLKTLDRTHDPEQLAGVMRNTREAGLEISVDLVFGTPGETLAQWKKTVRDALEWEPDHVSAYSLVVEPGTALARRIHRNELPAVDDDVQADMYGALDDALSAAGYDWYEISNWSKDPSLQSVHNRNYWTTEDWWGIGPGAHSHVGGVRWWNVKHPTAYTQRVSAGVSPALAREVLTEDQQHLEQVLLGLRMRDGVATDAVGAHKAPLIAEFISRGLLDGRRALAGRLVLTNEGRLVADHLVRELT